MELRTEGIFLSITGEYFPHLVMGLLLLGAAGFTQIRWIEGWRNWVGIFTPSQESGPSAFDRTLTGCGGLMAALLNAFLTIGFTVLAVDQLLFSGRLWEDIARWLGGLFPPI